MARVTIDSCPVGRKPLGAYLIVTVFVTPGLKFKLYLLAGLKLPLVTFEHVTSSDPTPFSRMLPNVIGDGSGVAIVCRLKARAKHHRESMPVYWTFIGHRRRPIS